MRMADNFIPYGQEAKAGRGKLKMHLGAKARLSLQGIEQKSSCPVPEHLQLVLC